MIRFEKEPTVVLHRRLYKENCYLLEIFTLSYGRLRAVAHIKKQKAYRLTGNYAPFSIFMILGQYKTELATIYSSEWQQDLTPQPQYLLNSFYINELLMRLLPYNLPVPEIFQIYLSTIQQCGTVQIRYFEYRLIDFLGLMPCMDTVTSGSYYRIKAHQGTLQFTTAAGGYHHKLVKALLNKQLPLKHPQLKALLQEIICLHSQHHPHTHATAVALKKLLKT